MYGRFYGGGQGVRQEAVCPIRFGAYNIRNGQNRGLESDLKGILQANVDLGVFQETYVTKGIYTQEYSGYRVVASEAPIIHRGSGAVFYCAEEHFSVEALQIYGANAVIFQLASSSQWWNIVGCCLALDNVSTI